MNKKNKIFRILGIVLCLCLCSLFLLIPVSNTLDEIDSQASMAVIFHTCDIQVDETATEDAWKLVTYVENYDMPEKEATEIKEEVLQVLREIKYYRTPKTIIYNILEDAPMFTEDKDVTIILYPQEEAEMLYIKGKYIMLDGKYYSLGFHGAEKGELYIEKIQDIMKNADEYLQESVE